MSAAAPWRSRIVGSGSEDPGQLLANPRNWRRHPTEQRAALRGSLDTVGWVAQVIVNTTTGHLIDGHARVEEALTRGEPTVPVLYVELSEQEEALVLATLDPIAAMAVAEQSVLDELLASLSVDDAGLAALLADLAGDLPKAGLTDPDEAPDLPQEPYVKTGELWILGDHRLLVGDATKAGDVARLMAGETAEAMWTDPPYGVGYVGKTRRALTIANDDERWSGRLRRSGSHRSSGTLCPLLRRRAGRTPPARLPPRDPGGRLASPPGAGLGQEQHRSGPLRLPLRPRADPVRLHPGPGRPGRGAHAGTRWYGDNSASSVLAYDKPSRNLEHPTMKPVGLVSECLANSTRCGDLVYEPFAGSGSTLIAAEQLGRRCYGIEIDPAYAQVTIERWQAFTGMEPHRG